jgi:hypothetical protein
MAESWQAAGIQSTTGAGLAVNVGDVVFYKSAIEALGAVYYRVISIAEDGSAVLSKPFHDVACTKPMRVH